MQKQKPHRRFWQWGFKFFVIELEPDRLATQQQRIQQQSKVPNRIHGVISNDPMRFGQSNCRSHVTKIFVGVVLAFRWASVR